MNTPVCIFNKSPAMCSEEPMPPMAKLSLPGLALARVSSDFKSAAGTAGLPTSRLGTVAIMLMGVKSSSGSKGSFGYKEALMVWLVKLTSRV